MTLPRIETPTFTVKLPSSNKEVTLRCMLVREEKLLLMAREGQDPAEILGAVKQVVINCLVSTESVDNLPLFDLEYLFLQIRAHSVGETASVSYIDNEEVNTAMEKYDSNTERGDTTERARVEALAVEQRKATRTFTIDLNKVEVKFPDKIEKNIKVSDKVGIVLRYPPASLYSDKEFLASSGEELADKLVMSCIETIYSGKDIHTIPYYGQGQVADKDELKEFIDNLDIKSYDKIKEFLTNLPHLYYVIEYKNKLGSERKIELTTLSDFFLF